MKKLVFAAATLAAVLTAVACGPPGEGGSTPAKRSGGWVQAVDSEMLARGQQAYTLNCAPCHGASGRGDGPGAATLNPKPRDHTDRALMDTLTDQKIADVVRMGGIVSGYPNMPSSPHIRGDDLVALVAYVRTLSRGAEGVDTVEVKTQ